ncbi:MAG: hypothetical protein JSS37_02845 [Proteobacteria bacterium]|nr:hypothetical protein [Pseudomonadota bacterium]
MDEEKKATNHKSTSTTTTEVKEPLSSEKHFPDPAMSTGKWIKANWLWLVAHFLNLGLGITIFLLEKERGESGIPILPVVIFMCIIFVYIYTYRIEPLPTEGSDPEGKKRIEIEETRSRQRNKWMIFAYSFMLLSLLLTFYPFINPLFSSYKQPQSGSDKEKISLDENQYLKTLNERPIAVFIGCSLDPEAKTLRCFETKSKEQAVKEKEGGEVKTDNREEKADKIKNVTSPSFGSAWVINIGGHIKECTNVNNGFGKSVDCKVKDGLLVPLYFIILALMGGSISLTRRLPELQKQAGSEHVATEKQPKLTQYEFRENLIFQMVQFISAPFLAILAYYLVEPSNTTNAVILAFTAGFASETILLMVRSIANKITPETNAVPQYGTVAGVVTFGNNNPALAGKPAEKIEVSLAGMQSITDKQGLYMLSNIPIGDHTILFTNKEMGVKIQEIVKIDRAQAIIKKNVTI